MAKVKKKVPAKRETKGRQHSARGASFKRIAKNIRQSERTCHAYARQSLRAGNTEQHNFQCCVAQTLRRVAIAVEKEAEYLRTILR